MRISHLPAASGMLAALALTLQHVTDLHARQHQHDDPGGGVGRVEFPVSCSDEAVPRFERAVAMLHSFWFEAAVAEFETVVEADPSCAMAHWGIAMTTMGNPFTRTLPAEERAAMGRAAAKRAVELARASSEREQSYSDAVLAYYNEDVSDRFDARMRAHEEAMRAVVAANPEDVEATIFLARAIIANAPPADLTFERQLEAAALLEPLFVRMPQHPGLAHYIIHAFDAPPIAKQGLEAARRYAEIAPNAPHALHMPTHTFTRLGHWDDSIELNRRSAWAEPDSNAAVHPMDYMVYAYLQLGQDRNAEAVVSRATQQSDAFYGGLLGYNFAAMRARFALEREAWAEAAALPVPENASPFVEAIPRFARAIGGARSEAAGAARAEVSELVRLREALESAGDAYWATIVRAQHLAAAAWLAHTEGDDETAVRLAREAADVEETVEKHPVTPGPLLPARELEGDLLIELERPAEALEAYERTLQREPRRARTLFGAARAAELAGDITKATRYYEELLELMENADTSRNEPVKARAFLAGR